MNNIEKKDKIQKRALNAWKKQNKHGTCRIVTGLGKTFVGLHALYTMPKNHDIIHLFLAEVTDRKRDLYKDIKKYNKIFNRDVLNDYNLEFHCYQSAYKWKNKSFGLVIADEISDSLTPAYMQFYKNNNYDALIGLTAYVNRSTLYTLENGDILTKGMILDKVAPVCFNYSLTTASEEKTIRKLNINIINNTLNKTEKVVKSGSKLKPFYQVETKAYDYWNHRFNSALYYVENLDTSDMSINDIAKANQRRDREIAISSRKRSEILYNSINKIKATKELLKHLKSKTLLFSNSLDSLLKITSNVISSRNSEKENRLIREKFDKGKIEVIGSFKKLKQGANLVDLDNVIMLSYYGVSGDFIQRAGRLRDDGTVGNIFIFLTRDTQEEKWFNKMTNGLLDSPNITVREYENIEECIKAIN